MNLAAEIKVKEKRLRRGWMGFIDNKISHSFSFLPFHIQDDFHHCFLSRSISDKYLKAVFAVGNFDIFYH